MKSCACGQGPYPTPGLRWPTSPRSSRRLPHACAIARRRAAERIAAAAGDDAAEPAASSRGTGSQPRGCAARRASDSRPASPARNPAASPAAHRSRAGRPVLARPVHEHDHATAVRDHDPGAPGQAERAVDRLDPRPRAARGPCGPSAARSSLYTRGSPRSRAASASAWRPASRRPGTIRTGTS